MASDPVAGLYEQLVTAELRRLLDRLDTARLDVTGADAADAHVAVAEHVRRIVERAFRSIPEEQRLTRQAELCNALLRWMGGEPGGGFRRPSLDRQT